MNDTICEISEAIAEEKWPIIFDPEHTPVFGRLPTHDEFMLHNEHLTPVEFRLLCHRLWKRYLRYVKTCDHSENVKLFISNSLMQTLNQ